MPRIYHGCFPKNADGANRIITPGEECLVPTDKFVWKDSFNVIIRVKTRSQAKTDPAVDFKTFDNYLLLKELIN